MESIENLHKLLQKDDNIINNIGEDCLYNSKDFLKKYTKIKNKTFYERDILAREVNHWIRFSVPVTRGIRSIDRVQAFNNVNLTIHFWKLPNYQNSKVELHKIINSIELIIGSMPYDKINGYFMETMLKYHNLNYTYTNEKLIIPIPFHLFLDNSLIFIDKLIFNDVKLNVDMNTSLTEFQIDKVSFDASFYNYNDSDLDLNFPEYKKLHQTVLPTIIKHNKDGKHLTSLVKRYQYDYYLISDSIYLPYNFPSSNLFFLFADGNDNIIKEQMFDYCYISFNGLDRLINTFSTIKKQENIEGVYQFNLKNLDISPHEQVNLSYIRDFRLNFFGLLHIDSKEIKVHTLLTHSNVLSYVNNSMFLHYTNDMRFLD
jgi:hypothetical protein